MPQGTGSGTGSRNDLVTFLGGLKEAGVEYNDNLAKAYNDLGWNRVSGGSYVIEAHGQNIKISMELQKHLKVSIQILL